MADLKTILRELSVIVGIGLSRDKIQHSIVNKKEFCEFILEYCHNINDFDIELQKICELSRFSDDQRAIVENGICLGKHITRRVISEESLFWVGSTNRGKYPFDIMIGEIGISLKEKSYIIKNPSFTYYLNALTQPKKFHGPVHVFRDFAPDIFQRWFEYTYAQLLFHIKKFGKENTDFYLYRKGNTVFYIKRKLEDLIFGERLFDHVGNVQFKEYCLPLRKTPKEIDFNEKVPNRIIEHTFSKWIKDNLEKTDSEYSEVKRDCAIQAGENILQFIREHLTDDLSGFLDILQIYEKEYYYAKSESLNPRVYLVPKSEDCIVKIINIEISVPRSQLNILFHFEITIEDNRGNEIKMHVECRYSHGQFNGVPEAKLYCKDDLSKLYRLIYV